VHLRGPGLDHTIPPPYILTNVCEGRRAEPDAGSDDPHRHHALSSSNVPCSTIVESGRRASHAAFRSQPSLPF
jgi:hypothetical protein